MFAIVSCRLSMLLPTVAWLGDVVICLNILIIFEECIRTIHSFTRVSFSFVLLDEI